MNDNPSVLRACGAAGSPRAALLALVFSLAAAQAFAQAPVEERRSSGEPIATAQQRVEFARRGMSEAGDRARQADIEHKQMLELLTAAKKRFDEAKARSDVARQSLDQARAKYAEARALYEKESSDFDRLRRGKGAK